MFRIRWAFIGTPETPPPPSNLYPHRIMNEVSIHYQEKQFHKITFQQTFRKIGKPQSLSPTNLLNKELNLTKNKKINK